MTPVKELLGTHGGNAVRGLKFAPSDAKFCSCAGNKDRSRVGLGTVQGRGASWRATAGTSRPATGILRINL